MIPSSTWPKGGDPLWRVLMEAPDEFSAESFAMCLAVFHLSARAFPQKGVVLVTGPLRHQ